MNSINDLEVLFKIPSVLKYFRLPHDKIHRAIGALAFIVMQPKNRSYWTAMQDEDEISNIDTSNHLVRVKNDYPESGIYVDRNNVYMHTDNSWFKLIK